MESMTEIIFLSLSFKFMIMLNGEIPQKHKFHDISIINFLKLFWGLGCGSVVGDLPDMYEPQVQYLSTAKKIFLNDLIT